MIKINNLQARVEDKEILKGINLEINPSIGGLNVYARSPCALVREYL